VPPVATNTGEDAIEPLTLAEDVGRTAISVHCSQHSPAGAELHDLTGTGDRAVEAVSVGAIEDERLVDARITQGIAGVAAKRDIAENAAARPAGAELQGSAVDGGAAGIGGVACDGQGARAVFVERARKTRSVEACSVGQEGGVGPRVVIGEAKLQHRRLREIAGDIIEREGAASDRRDREHVHERIV
jgi:hypothetical protein